MMVDLLPCPFCGGEPIFKPDNLFSNDHRNIHASWVECFKCGSEGKHFVDRYDNDCRKEAKIFWNTRNEKSNLSEEMFSVLQLVMKDSTNFKLKAPNYIIDKIEKVIELYEKEKETK